MANFIVNDPNDLLVLRVDGTVARVPVGQGSYTVKPLKPTGENESCFAAEDAGLDLAYISVEEMAPRRRKALRKKLEQALQDSMPPATNSRTLVNYLENVGLYALYALKIQQEERDGLGAMDPELITQYTYLQEKYWLPGPEFRPGIAEKFSQQIAEQVKWELNRLFPYAPQLADAVSTSPDMPFVKIDHEALEQYLMANHPGGVKFNTCRQALSDYFSTDFGKAKGGALSKLVENRIKLDAELHKTVDGIICKLEEECKSTKLSPDSQKLVAELKQFPEQVKDDRLRPLFKLPFKDKNLTFKLSPGNSISDWMPRLTLNRCNGIYNVVINTITLPNATRGFDDFGYPSALKRPPLPCLDRPLNRKARYHDNPIHIVRMEEMFHYVMNQTFKNYALPYEHDDAPARWAHIDAVLADLTTDGRTPRMDLLEKLGLKSYLRSGIDFARQVVEQWSPNPNGENLGPEVVAKVVNLIEAEGWDKARELMPRVTEDFEKRVLPRCLKLCADRGIKPDENQMPDSLADSVAEVTPTRKSILKR